MSKFASQNFYSRLGIRQSIYIAAVFMLGTISILSALHIAQVIKLNNKATLFQSTNQFLHALRKVDISFIHEQLLGVKIISLEPNVLESDFNTLGLLQKQNDNHIHSLKSRMYELYSNGNSDNKIPNLAEKALENLMKLYNEHQLLRERLVANNSVSISSWHGSVAKIISALSHLQIVLLQPQDALQADLYQKTEVINISTNLYNLVAEEGTYTSQLLTPHLMKNAGRTHQALVSVRTNITNEMSKLSYTIQKLQSIKSVQSSYNALVERMEEIKQLRLFIKAQNLMGLDVDIGPEEWFEKHKTLLDSIENLQRASFLSSIKTAETWQNKVQLSIASSIVIGLVIILTLLGIIFFVTNRVMQPISIITRNMLNLAEGDLGTELPTTPREDEIGDMIQALRVFRNNAITLKNQTSALRKSEERFNLAVKGSRDGIWDWDIRTGKVFFSSRFLSDLSLDETDFSNTFEGLESLVHSEDYDVFQESIAAHVEKRVPFDIEVRLRSSDGFYPWFHMRGQAIWGGQGSALRMAGSLSNITQRKHLETELIRARDMAEQANQAKSEFLATMSHEIRTPLNGVIGMTDLLNLTHLNDKQKDFVETIKTSGESLLSVINDILDLSKIESGLIEIENQSFDVSKCINDALDIVRPKASAKGLKVIDNIPSDIPKYIISDRARLRQILINLSGNAIKFTNEGSLTVTVEVESTHGDELTLLFKVKDTGIGINLEQQQKLFKPFSQVDSSISRRYGGSGLGLSISKKLANLLGGYIGVDSELGYGSTFYFTVKARADYNAEVRVKEREAFQDLNILVIDSSYNRLEKDARAFEQLGCTVNEDLRGEKVMSWIERGVNFDVGFIHGAIGLDRAINLYKSIRKIKNERELPLVLIAPKEIANTHSSVELFTHIISSMSDSAEVFNVLNSYLENKEEKVRDIAEDLNILIVEDNPINQKLAEHMFKQLGYEVDLADNGQEGVNAVLQKHYDLVFMDVQMPVMDGLEASQVISDKFTVDEKPAIIAMTANAMEGDREKCLASGMDDYISKPVRAEKLQKVINKWGSKSY